jgi:hypothetical protein
MMTKDGEIFRRWKCERYFYFDHGNFTFWTRAEMWRSPFNYRIQRWEFLNQDHVDSLMGHCQKWSPYWDLIREFETYGVSKFRQKDPMKITFPRHLPLEPQIAAWQCGLGTVEDPDFDVEVYGDEEYEAAWTKLRSSLRTRKLDVEF